MKKILAIAVFILCSAAANADCTLYDTTGYGPTARGTWACVDDHGSRYDVNMNLWQGLIDLGY